MRNIVVGLGLAIATSLSASAQVTITNLGLPPSQAGVGPPTGATASSISNDGRTVIGTTSNGNWNRAFTWRNGQGMSDTSNIYMSATASAMSADGRTVVGTVGEYWQSYRASVWTNGNPPGELSKSIDGLGSAFHTFARGVSADGQIIVGTASMNGGPSHAVRWGNGLAVSLGTGGGTNTGSGAYAISGNGSTIVGFVDGTLANNTYYTRAMRWTATTGITELGFQTMGANYSQSSATNFDGSVIGGYFQDPFSGSSKAFRWTEAGGIQDLGLLTGATSSSVTGMSLSGDVLLGRCGGLANGAFLWTQSTGMASLHSYLTGLGVNLQGWNLDAAVGLSADGSVLVGNGTYEGQSRSFIVTGLAVPSPATLPLIALSLVACRKRRI